MELILENLKRPDLVENRFEVLKTLSSKPKEYKVKCKEYFSQR